MTIEVGAPKLPPTTPGHLMPDPLYIDPKLLKNDFHYRFCHKAMQDYWKYFGYEPVRYDECKTHTKNERGYVSLADVILMKVPMKHWLAVSKQQTDNIENRQRAAKNRFHVEGEKLGIVETFEIDKTGKEIT